MKQLMSAALVLTTLLATTEAKAIGYFCCIDIWANPGVGCERDDTMPTEGSCNSTWGVCSSNYGGCEPAKMVEANPEEKLKIEIAQAQETADAVQAQQEGRVKETGDYKGYIGSQNKSNQGRITSAKAELDVCFKDGYSNVDYFETQSNPLSACQAACDNISGTSAMNNSCITDLGASHQMDCWYRCDAVF